MTGVFVMNTGHAVPINDKRCTTASRAIIWRSSTLNMGCFSELTRTATMSSSKIVAPRCVISRCPFVKGSKDPGYTALIKGFPPRPLPGGKRRGSYLRIFYHRVVWKYLVLAPSWNVRRRRFPPEQKAPNSVQEGEGAPFPNRFRREDRQRQRRTCLDRKHLVAVFRGVWAKISEHPNIRNRRLSCRTFEQIVSI